MKTLLPLLTDSEPWVRYSAATDTLGLDASSAEKTLRELVASTTGFLQFNAKWSLDKRSG
jgi:hypothetical protein